MATILVEILGSAKQFKSELDGAVASTEKANSSFAKMSKVAGVAGLAIAGGLAVGLVKSVEAASNAEAATVRLNAAFAASHVSAKRFASSIEAAETSSRKLGFSNEEVKTSLGSLIVATHNGHKAISDLSVAQDIARFKHVSLETATKSLTMAMAGSQRATKALGIDVPKVTSHYDALKATFGTTISASEKLQLAHAKLQDKMATSNLVIETVSQKLHGQAQAYADTAAGGMAQFHAQLGNLEEKIGTALLPAMTQATAVLTRFVNYLSTSPEVAHAAATALQVFKDVMVVVIAVGQRLLTWMQQNQTATKAIVAGLAVLAIAFAGPVVAIVALGVALIELYKHSQQFRNIVNAAMEDVKQKFNDVFPTIKAIVTQSITAAVTVAEAVWKRFGGALTSIAKIALQTIANEFRDFGNIIKGVVNLIGDLIHGRWSKIWGDLETIVKGVFAGIEDLVTGEAKIIFIEAKAIGSALTDGIVAGVGDLAGALKDKVTGGIGSALGGIGHFIKKGSPSRLFADEVGKPIGEGVIQGWLESTATLPAKMSQGLQNAITAGRAVIQAAQSSFKNAWSSLASDADAAFQKMHSSIQTKTEKIIAAIQVAGQKAQLASNLIAAQGQLSSAQAGPNQTDAEKALAALQATHDETARNQAVANAQGQLATAQAGGDPAAILSAQQQLADAQYTIQVASLQKQIDAETAAATQKNAIATAQQAVDDANQAISDAARDERLKKQAEKERLNLDARTALQQRHFDAALEKLQTHLAKGHASYEEAQKAILKLFKSFGVDYKAAGADLGTAFITGLKELIHDAATKGGDLSTKLESVSAGIHIPHAATGGFVSQTGLAVIHQGETITPAGQGGGVTVIVNGWVGNDQDIAEKIRNALIRTGRSTTGGALGGFA